MSHSALFPLLGRHKGMTERNPYMPRALVKSPPILCLWGAGGEGNREAAAKRETKKTFT